MSFAAAAALGAAALAASTSAYAVDTQFAFLGGFALNYNSTTGILKTNGAEATTMTFPTGSGLANLFPSGIAVTITVTASKDGTVNETPLNGLSYSFWEQPLDDTDLKIVYTGSNVTIAGHTVLTHNETIAQLTGVDSNLSGYTGTGAPLGVNYSFDDQSPPAAGDYTPAYVAGSSFFDWTPNGDTVLEDDFSFVDSSKRASISKSGNTYKLATTSINPNGNLSADPNPPVPGVPEPASWALMLVGVGAVGGAMRRRVMPVRA